MGVDAKSHLEHRKPFDVLEESLLQLHLSMPQDCSSWELDALRYVLNFAKLTVVRGSDGEDRDVRELLGTHAWRVRDQLACLEGVEASLQAAVAQLPTLVASTGEKRDLLEEHGLDREAIDAEIANRKLILSLGGGGGAGFGYAGVFTLLDRHDLTPSLICGTSIGALLGLFRARRLRHDGRAMLEVSNSLSWNRVFSVGGEASRYGLPATLRLHLRRALADFLIGPEDRVFRFNELPLPMHIVTTGLTVEALKHELEYYEHFLDDAVRPGLVFRANRITKVRNVASVLRELMSEPDTLKEIVFGRDPLTLDADCLDAAGFSSGIPGLLHYDVHRDDHHMRGLLDSLYAEYGITRLVEGGVTDNVPIKVAYESAMAGRLEGHRNVFVLAVDCFAPKPTSVVFYPVQQLVRANVVRNIPYAHLYHPIGRTLNPINLVPSPSQIKKGMNWVMHEFQQYLPLLEAIFRPIPTLSAEDWPSPPTQ